MTDVYLFNTDDGGEIDIIDGVVTLTDSARVAIYLSLFGGNVDDNGQDDSVRQWWGNYDEQDVAKKQRSTFQNLFNTVPAIPINLQRIQDAAVFDLAWLTEGGFADSVEVVCTIPGLNRVRVQITIVAQDGKTDMVLSEDWRGAA